MENPFELILEKLDRIENLIYELKGCSPEIASSGGIVAILTVKQAAAFTNLSLSRIYKLTSTREIPHYKKGKRLYFKKEELHEWLTQNKIMSQAEIEREAINYVIKNRRR